MIESYQFFLALHLYSVLVSGALMLIYLVLTQGNFRTEFDFIRRIRVFLPLYYFFFAVVFFTGFLLFALKHYELSLSVKYMLVAWVAIFGLSIFQFVAFKKARKSKRYKPFRSLSFFVLFVSLLLLALSFKIP